jgi:hypothetical protein
MKVMGNLSNFALGNAMYTLRFEIGGEEGKVAVLGNQGQCHIELFICAISAYARAIGCHGNRRL